MKRLSILGCTGSIGRNVLRIVEQFPERFSVAALAAGRNADLLLAQIRQYAPEVVAVLDDGLADHVRKQLGRQANIEILSGAGGYKAVATLDSADLVVSAMVGSAGLLPTLAAVEHGKAVALANKESLVMAGEMLMETARRHGVPIIPVDSEHSAVFQALAGQRKQDLKKILLTASGGPFLKTSKEELENISPEVALRHPTWSMGQKITIDSATLMNKGLEVMEARWLFDVPLEAIEVVIHPESIIHSMVAYCDGSVIAQMGLPDMRIPIAYALSYPERLCLDLPWPDFCRMGALTFQEPDPDKFPCLALAFQACRAGGTYPAVLNGANETAVHAFLSRRIRFGQISRIVGDTLDKHASVSDPGLSDILSADAWARRAAEVAV
jgi:1-deoxy-D-xylulose-5-phosphate reductoisomerase